jgi:hypothetical protein
LFQPIFPDASDYATSHPSFSGLIFLKLCEGLGLIPRTESSKHLVLSTATQSEASAAPTSKCILNRIVLLILT